MKALELSRSIFPKCLRLFSRLRKWVRGLALASCRKILRDMGCDIQAASEQGKGATFTVTIPRESSGKPLAVDPIATVI